MTWQPNTNVTSPPPVCINCGFIGAAHYVNGYGPYCGRCAAQAAGPVAPQVEDPQEPFIWRGADPPGTVVLSTDCSQPNSRPGWPQFTMNLPGLLL